MIYLDHNATAPMRPEVAAAMAESFALTGNPSSVHRFGRLARKAVEGARAAVAAAVGARAEQVIFTSGGTEANALALTGLPDRRLLVSAVEHESVLKARPAERIPVDSRGLVRLDQLARMLEGSPALVSVMLANNETGTIQPVAEVASLAHLEGALVHCDAVQAFGRIPVDFEALGVDLLSLSAHKIGGPQGVGALILRDGVALEPLLKGGGQERFRRAGTENVPGIVGFGRAAELAASDLGAMEQVACLRDEIEAGLRALAPDLAVWGVAAPRLPNTTCIGLAGLSGETQVMAMDLAGIAVSAGSACSSGKGRPSHVLAAMGASAEETSSAIRISLGTGTSREEINRFVDAWRGLYVRGPWASGRSAA